MDVFVKKISENKIDESVHNEFVKFSRGVFENKYLIEAKRGKEGWAIKTGPEFANFLVRSCLEKTSGVVDVTGAIVSTLDMKKDMPFEMVRVKQFMGIKQIIIDTKVSPDKVIEFMDRFPKAFFALSFKNDSSVLKIKAKAPKSAKPAATGEKAPTPDFCSIKTSDADLVKGLLFDVGDFKEVSINHTLKINDIIIDMKEKDPVKMRENAKRKGVIVRKMIIDGKETIKEYPFEA